LEGSRPDWQIIQDIANRLGAKWQYQHPSEIYREIASLTPLFAGVTYDRLEGFKSLHWPVAKDGTDSRAYTSSLPFRMAKPGLFPLSLTEPTGPAQREFDLHLNNGRLLEHFHEGNMTYKSEGIRERLPILCRSLTELAKERGIQSGTWVQLTSRYGQLRVRALVTDRVQGKELYMPMNSVESPVNRLTSSHTDPVTHTPAYKEASVHLRVLQEVGESPLPRINHRFGHPTPRRRRSRAEVEAHRLSHSCNGSCRFKRTKREEKKHGPTHSSGIAQSATRGKNYVPGWSRRRLSMPKRFSPALKCCKLCMPRVPRTAARHA